MINIHPYITIRYALALITIDNAMDFSSHTYTKRKQQDDINKKESKHRFSEIATFAKYNETSIIPTKLNADVIHATIIPKCGRRRIFINTLKIPPHIDIMEFSLVFSLAVIIVP